MNNETKIVAGVCLLFFIIIFMMFWSGAGLNQPTTAKNPDILIRTNSHMTRPASGVGQAVKIGAKVTMVEFGDFECPACGAASPTINKIIDLYKNNPDFNFVFRNFPLPQHKNAIPAALAAESAGAQGKYFEMETMLYDNQSKWAESADPTPEFLKYATALKLDIAKFTDDLTGHKFASVVQSDLLDGQTIGINHTPTLFINGIEEANLDFNNLKNKISDLLAK